MNKAFPLLGDRKGLYDPLTGIYSRLTLQQRLQEEVNRARRYQDPLTIMMVDLDNFKSINDAFGHQRGDQILIEFAERIQTTLRDSDLIFRYGGDEFVVLLPKTTKEQSILLAQRLLTATRDLPFDGTPPVTLTASIGTASFLEDGQTPESLFEKADLRSYEAKRAGRDRFINEDAGQRDELPFNEFSRLVERDTALKTMNTFYEKLPEESRGLFLVTGLAGSGKSRFLEEIGKIGRLQGYEVIDLHCRWALRSRALGVLNEACIEVDIPSPVMSRDEFGRLLYNLTEERNRSGILILADDLHQADWVTLETLDWLIYSSPIPVLGLAYTYNPALSSRIGILDQVHYQETVELFPLTKDGVRIWLRSILQWEVPQDFLERIYCETRGLPSLVESAILNLVHRGILVREGDSWRIGADINTLSIQEYLHPRDRSAILNLPSPLTLFVGRDVEIQSAKHSLEANPLLTIYGSGGVGKTRLAVQVAAEMADSFPNGVYFVLLDTVTNVDVLVSTIAETLGFKFFSRESQLVQLVNYLREKNLLLLLDNFEQLVKYSKVVSDILENATMVKIMVTSRERLNLRGETVLELRGMSYPSEEDLSGAESYNAVQLFVHLARKIQPEFSLTSADKTYITRICQQVEGSPLGIELAAAWIPYLSCQEIAEEIEHSIDFLTSTGRDIPERHRSMRAVFESSWRLLTAEEQKVLARLSVFQGSFRREAAINVSGANLPVLSSLVNKSLLRARSVSPGQAPRYELHEVVCRFGQEKLSEDVDAEEKVKARHCEYYVTLLHQIGTRMNGPEQQGVLRQITEELRDIRAAWKWALEHQNYTAIDKSLDGLYLYYVMKGLYYEGTEAFGAVERELSKWVDLSSEKMTQEMYLLGRVLGRYVTFYQRTMNYDLTKEMIQKSYAIVSKFGNLQEQAFILLRMGSCYDEMSEYAQAREYTQNCLQIYQDIGDQDAISKALNLLGILAYEQGEYIEAKGLHENALELARKVGNLWEVGRSLINLGNVEADIGEYKQAIQHYRESLVISQEYSDRSGMAVLLNNMGDVMRVTGDFGEAVHLLDKSIELCEELGDMVGLAIALNNRGEVAYRFGDYESASKNFHRALSLYTRLGSRLGIAYSHYYLGLAAAAQDVTKKAMEHFCLALKSGVDNQSPPLAFITMVECVPILAKEGQVGLAQETLELIFADPTCMEETRERARSLFMVLDKYIPLDVLLSLPEKGTIKTMESIASAVLLFGDLFTSAKPHNEYKQENP